MKTKDNVAEFLGDLAHGSKHRSDQLINAGALQPLVTLLKEGSDEAKTRAAYAIGNLAIGERQIVQIVNAGALQPLESLLQDGKDSITKTMAASALGNLSANSKQRSAEIMNLGAIQLLVTLHKDLELSQTQAAYALAKLAANSEQQSAQIFYAGALQPLVTLLREGTTLNAKHKAVTALSKPGHQHQLSG